MPDVDRKGESRWLNIVSAQQVKELCQSHRNEGSIIALCHGVFDILHPGHLEHLAEAKEIADILVVSVTADRYVNKGPGRPVLNQDSRAKMLASLDLVDYVFISDFPTAVESIGLVRPSFFVKGPDYRDTNSDISGNIDKEVRAVADAGGKVVFTNAPSMSSSALINNAGLGQENELRTWLGEIRTSVSSDDVSRWVESFRSLKVLVIGEIIVDRYIFCDALGKTSKEPVLAFLEKSQEEQLGGSLAIARHVSGLGAQTTLLSRLGDDDLGRTLRKQIDATEVFRSVIHSSSHSNTIVKTRFLDEHTGTKVFETYTMSDDPPEQKDEQQFIELLDKVGENFDLVLVADYGHGLLSDRVVQALCSKSFTLSINTQSNAGNRGFNSISRYPRADIVCLNGGEISLELRKKHTTVPKLLPELGGITGAEWIVVTEGARGLAMWNKELGVTSVPAFTEQVRDRVGAGDALFAAVSLGLTAGAPPEIVGLFGNLAGASMVSDLGNRYSLNSIDLIRHSHIALK